MGDGGRGNTEEKKYKINREREERVDREER